MTTMASQIGGMMARELTTLKQEIEAYGSDADVWRTPPGITNSAGTLALHLAGNLRHFVGGVLGAWATHAAPTASPWEAAQQPTKDLGTAWNKAVDTSSLGSLQEARETTSNWIDVANRAINLPQETLFAVSQNLLDHIAPTLAAGELAPLVFVDAVVALNSQEVGRGWIFDITLGVFGKDVGKPLASEGVNTLLQKVFA